MLIVLRFIKNDLNALFISVRISGEYEVLVLLLRTYWDHLFFSEVIKAILNHEYLLYILK
jgi:hypothetical protein